MVRQSFSHGRSKQVVVEVKKRRTPGADGKPEAAARLPPRGPGRQARRPHAGRQARHAGPGLRPTRPRRRAKPSGVVLRTLTDEEQSRRAHALGDARLREAEERKIAEEEAKIRAQRDAIEKTEREAAEARKREEDERRKHDEVTKKKADEVAKKRFGEGETAATAKAPGARPKLEAEEERRPAHGPPRSRRRDAPGCSAAASDPRGQDRDRTAARPADAGHRHERG